MADVNVKTIQTRIALKYDSYANWTNTDVADQGANLVLLRGELGICEVKSSNEQTKDANVIPTVLFKVGDGETPFKDLPWASAKAADVYAWAKASDLVVEGKSIKFVGVKDAEGNDKKITFNFATPEEVAAAVKVVSDNLAGVNARVVALENKFTGDGSVQGQIDALDGRLDVIEGADTVEGSVAKALKDAKAYTDTRETAITTAYEAYANQAEADAVATAKGYTDTEVKKASDAAADVASDLSAHVANKENPHGVTAEQVGLGKVENKTVAEIKTEFTGAVAADNEGFVTGGAAYTAIEAAKTYADGLNTAMDTRVDALEAAKNAQDTTNENLTKAIADEKSARETAVSDEATARDNADKAINAKIGTVAEGKTVVKMIEDAQAAAEATAASDAAAKVKALADGQVATNASEISRVEGLVTAEVKAREDADKAIDERLDAVEAFFATTEGETLDTALDTLVEIQEYLNGDGSATGGIIERVAQAETDIDNLEKEFNTDAGRVKVAEGKIAALEAKDTELSAAIDTKLATSDFNTWKGTHENSHAKSATEITSEINTAVSGEKSAREAADALINEKFGADYSKDATVASAIADAKAAGTGAASEATRAHGRLDIVEPKVTTLQDLADGYTGKGSIKSAVDAAKKAADDAQDAADKAQDDVDALELVVNNETTGLAATKKIADDAAADLAALTGDNGRVKAAENAIDALELIVNDASKGNDKLRTDVNALQTLTGENGAIRSEIADAKKAGTDAAAAVDALSKGQVATNKTDIGTLNGKVAAIEADYLKAADAYIFNCGSATTVTHKA